MYVLLPVIFLLVFLPINIEININAKLKDEKIELEPLQKMKNNICIKLFKVLPIYKHKLFLSKRKQKKKKSKSNGLKLAKIAIKTLKINSIYLYLGLNLYDYVINSYLNALLNTTICMYVNINEEKFNLNKLYYQIYTSDIPLVINLEANVSTSIAKFLYIILKGKIKSNKQDKKMHKNKVSCTY